ncbi:MAG: hypothetical protein LBE02_02190, partial [Spirochaetaceae bacterium]|nr:hypothetical protein [Spirochaetaceae bacterium]
MEHELNLPLEIFRAAAVFAAFLGGFYRLVRPGARRRRIALLLAMRKYPATLPLRFWLATLLPLYAGWALFNIFIEQDASPSEIGGGTIWFGLSFGVLLLALNLLVFYLYVKLSAAYEARVFAGELANTPPVWTA